MNSVTMIGFSLLAETGVAYPLGKFVQRAVGWFKNGEAGKIMGTDKQKILEDLGVKFPDTMLPFQSGAKSLIHDHPHPPPREKGHSRGITDIEDNAKAGTGCIASSFCANTVCTRSSLTSRARVRTFPYFPTHRNFEMHKKNIHTLSHTHSLVFSLSLSFSLKHTPPHIRIHTHAHATACKHTRKHTLM